MQLIHIAAFTTAALLARLAGGGRWRNPIILIGSLIALFWLQPATPIRNLDFWFPLATFGLTALVWTVTRPAGTRPARADWIVLAGGLALILAVSLSRYAGPLCCLTASRPPQPWLVAPALLVVGLLGFAIVRFVSGRKPAALIAVLLLIGLLIVLKLDPLTRAASALLRGLMEQSVEQASALDIRWLGISYVAFRLIHVLRDYQGDRLPDLRLSEFVSYVLFFPALTAGPIDRADRFVAEYRQPLPLTWDTVYQAGSRIVIGLFKKYALADTLALIALDDMRAAQTHSTLWLWVMLYGFTFRIYLDFAGYSDITIGLGRLHGITWNSLIWGAWQGIGLFAHTRWAARQRARATAPVGASSSGRLRRVVNVLLTFHFFLLSAVWFALSSPAASWDVYLRLFGVK